MQKKGKKKHPKKHYKFACFYASQNGFLFLDQANWRMQKSFKNYRKRAKHLIQIPRFSTPRNGFFLFLGHFKNTMKIKEICPKNLLKLLKNRSKFLIFRYPKMAFH
jgi:hypothetical protein